MVKDWLVYITEVSLFVLYFSLLFSAPFYVYVSDPSSTTACTMNKLSTDLSQLTQMGAEQSLRSGREIYPNGMDVSDNWRPCQRPYTYGCIKRACKHEAHDCLELAHDSYTCFDDLASSDHPCTFTLMSLSTTSTIYRELFLSILPSSLAFQNWALVNRQAIFTLNPEA